jgi:hypothetical protein
MSIVMQNPIHRISFVLSLLVAGSSLAACGDDEAATSGSGGGASSSGSSTTGASTGHSSATSSGATNDTTGGTGGGDGGGSTAGSGGTGGGEPAIDPFLEKCLWIDACEADGGAPMGVEACLASAYETQWGWASAGFGELLLGVMECRLQAEDCATERACAPDPGIFDDLCADVPGTDFCEGDVWVICDPEGAGAAALDCSARGESCGTDFFSGCGIERCSIVDDPSSCDDDDPNVLLTCTGAGFVKRVDCATQNNFVFINSPEGEEVYTIAGEVCGPDEAMGGAMGCVGTGDDCDFFGQACDGDVMETCAGGKLGRRDCSALDPEGQSCGFVQQGSFAGGVACGAVEPPCELVEGDETCDDGVLSFCGYAGAETLDCAAAGYAGCDTATRGGRTIAFCTE